MPALFGALSYAGLFAACPYKRNTPAKKSFIVTFLFTARSTMSVIKDALDALLDAGRLTPQDHKKARASVGRPRKYASDSERLAAFRARHDLVQLNVQISRELNDALDAYVMRQAKDGAGLTKAEVVAKLLCTQLLRKR